MIDSGKGQCYLIQREQIDQLEKAFKARDEQAFWEAIRTCSTIEIEPGEAINIIRTFVGKERNNPG